MPKRFFKRLSPSPETIKGNKVLGCLGSALHQPNLWHFNRRSVATAFAIGLFCMWIPFPPQTLMAAAVAVLCRANVPVSVALVFITNPITIPPMFYFAYELGANILREDIQPVSFSLSTEWLKSILHIWEPMLLGLGLLAVVSAITGYYGIRLFWRLHLLQRIRERKDRKTRPHRQRVHPHDPDSPAHKSNLKQAGKDAEKDKDGDKPEG